MLELNAARGPAVLDRIVDILFEHTSRSDDGNPARALWRWRVTPIPGQRSRVEVSWRVSPRTFWRRALFGKLRRRQMGDEVPASLRALAALLARRPQLAGEG